ncbi:maleylpyruvate isomerase family mycothiol-dependent enzyme [Microlunatus elymi]|uniref:Maleylpyruvate isomerase family mycothiol-dependent enzyme n=1 Tax=Microlunatus elymi TaxID=2596828 RepID=A0A516Q279_9ACTN|nr:maleylpyruvate isomerase family mycothiol-dependent enzyme [Microlunatus elymi]QDP97539.1 maleylpyruvate isomerase family mycothiol-dependent enzyme [Microlunatus elymi]
MSERPTPDQPAPRHAAEAADDAVGGETDVRSLLAGAHRRLLGDTIAVSDPDWKAPSKLPGWSRAQVATHIARHADAIYRLADWALTGVEQEMYPNNRDAEIDAGADRTGLEIQTDLDTSAGRLEEQLEKLAEADAWDRTVRFRDGSTAAATLLPNGRLCEVLVHHLDLDLGVGVADLDQAAAEAALAWAAFRQSHRPGYPSLKLITDSGAVITIGDVDHDPLAVRGPANLLLGWLTQRSGTDGLTGAVDDLPSFG